jgi:hypothetical protein
MAYISNKPAEGTSVSLTAGSPQAAPVYVPDNCHTLIVYNPNADDALLQWLGDGNPGLFNAATAVRIPAGSSLTLAIGASSARVKDAYYDGANYDEEIPYYDLASGTGDVYITYVNAPSA